MITKCESGANAGQADILGMAQILAAYDWGIMTDMFGNIPCSEAFKASAPKVDSQESIYENINNLLDAAIVNLGKAIDGKMKMQEAKMYFSMVTAASGEVWPML